MKAWNNYAFNKGLTSRDFQKRTLYKQTKIHRTCPKMKSIVFRYYGGCHTPSQKASPLDLPPMKSNFIQGFMEIKLKAGQPSLKFEPPSHPHFKRSGYMPLNIIANIVFVFLSHCFPLQFWEDQDIRITKPVLLCITSPLQDMFCCRRWGSKALQIWLWRWQRIR